MLTDTRGCLLFTFEKKKKKPGLFCELLVCCLSQFSRPPVLPSLGSGGGVGRYSCDCLLSDFILTAYLFVISSHHTHIHTCLGDPLLRVSLADTSLSGRFRCHHGNPASGQERLLPDCFSAHSAPGQHVDQLSPAN